MSDVGTSTLDLWLERFSKMAAILLPVAIAVVGGMYTLQKDRNDDAVRVQQRKRDENQISSITRKNSMPI